jgi:hypothetical protein
MPMGILVPMPSGWSWCRRREDNGKQLECWSNGVLGLAVYAAQVNRDVKLSIGNENVLEDI